MSSNQLKHFAGSGLYLNTPNDWLTARVHSMAKPPRLPFGHLVVLNDDIVLPNSGFPTHPHSDMEIFTYIVKGSLTHKDSMNTKETLTAGDVQYMSAGTGVTHSEFNEHKNQSLRVLQVWLQPDQKGLTPAYGSSRFAKQDKKDKWLHILSGNGGDYPSESLPGYSTKAEQPLIRLHQDVNVFVGEFAKSASFPLRPGRMAYIVCVEGAAEISAGGRPVAVEMYDSIQARGPCTLSIEVVPPVAAPDEETAGKGKKGAAVNGDAAGKSSGNGGGKARNGGKKGAIAKGGSGEEAGPGPGATGSAPPAASVHLMVIELKATS